MLTEAEQTLVHQISKELSKDERAFKVGGCFITGQLAVCTDATPSKEFLYHEGYLLKPGGERMRHAWNTLNGKLVDFSSPAPEYSDGNHEFYEEYYRAEHTFTQFEVLLSRLANGLSWMGEKGSKSRKGPIA